MEEGDETGGAGWTGRRFGLLALVAVVAILIAQLSGLGDVDQRLDNTSFFLLILALLIGLVLLAPEAVKEVLDRTNLVKFGQFEVRMEATNRAERVEALLIDPPDEVSTRFPLPAGGPGSQYASVRRKLEEKLRWLGENVLEPSDPSDLGSTITVIEEKKLLTRDELHLIRDLLGGMEGEVEKLPEEIRGEYLHLSWRFAQRFRTLIFERLVRREMARKGWFIFDFAQSPRHRPDFLAFRRGAWLLIATRVRPEDTQEVRERLSRMKPPFEADAVVVVPDTQAIPAEHAEEIMHLSTAIARRTTA